MFETMLHEESMISCLNLYKLYELDSVLERAAPHVGAKGSKAIYENHLKTLHQTTLAIWQFHKQCSLHSFASWLLIRKESHPICCNQEPLNIPL